MIESGRQAVADIGFIIAAALVLLGFRFVCVPRTARRGVWAVAAALIIGALVSFLVPGVRDTNILLMLVGLLLGGGAGWLGATRARPELVPSLTAGLGASGALAVALIPLAEADRLEVFGRVSVAALAGAAVFAGLATGSGIVGFLRLRGLVSEPAPLLPRHEQAQLGAGALVIGCFVLSILIRHDFVSGLLLILLVLAAAGLGGLSALRIPTDQVYSAVAATSVALGPALVLLGLALRLELLLIVGGLLTAISVMLAAQAARQLPRSVSEIAIATMLGIPGGIPVWGGRRSGAPRIQEIRPEEAAIPLAYARRIVVIPGYGLAVAQAQHELRALADLLIDRGAQVRFAVHPSAGRVAGQLATLLAEADLPIMDLADPDIANAELERADVALIVGANDVVNPAGEADTGALAGLPMLRPERASRVIILKRGAGTGYAGVQNPLLREPHTAILYGDARDTLNRLIGAVEAA